MDSSIKDITEDTMSLVSFQLKPHDVHSYCTTPKSLLKDGQFLSLPERLSEEAGTEKDL